MTSEDERLVDRVKVFTVRRLAVLAILGGLLAACGGASTSSGTKTEVFRETSGDLSGFYWQISGPSRAVASAVDGVRTGKDKVVAHFIAVKRALGNKDCTIHIAPVTVRVYGHKGPEAVAFCQGLSGK
jgi:hypothetical protein